MKFIEIIFIFFLLIYVAIIISIYVYKQSYISNKTECTSIYSKKYYRRKRDIVKAKSFSWNPPIKYYVKSPVNSGNVKKAIEIISNNTCFNFIESSSSFDSGEGLIFQQYHSCASYVGNIGKTKPQEIFLARGCYNSVPHILHEIGHALGLIHEHSRSDRNKYVEIHLENVQNDEKPNFKTYNETNYRNYGTSYDFSSIMHYKFNDFAIDENKAVISSKKVVTSLKIHDPYNRMMGQRKKMTFNDIKQINLRYCDKCNWFDTDGKRNRSYSNVKCRNGGYPDYNNCSRCICPTGYTGNNCNKIVSSDESCGNTKFKAQSFIRNLFFDDKKTCYIFLLAKPKKRIKIRIHFSNTPYRDICTEETSNQIKYKRDKGNTGMLLCGRYIDTIRLTSESNSVLIIFRGFFKNNGIFLTFQAHNRKKKIRKYKGRKNKK